MDRVLRWIFGSKTDEVTGGGWRRLHYEVFSDLYCSPNIVRAIKPIIMRWVGHVARMREKKVAHRVLVGKASGREITWRAGRRYEDNIK